MKHLSMFLVLIAALVFMTGKEAAADCPDGHTFKADTITVNGCDYHIEICYQCNAASPSIVQVMMFYKLNPNCYQSWNLNQVFQDICSQVYDPIYVHALCGMPGPCGDGKEYDLKTPICWQKTLVNGVVKHTPCEPIVYCVEYWEYCWDTDLNQFVRIRRGLPPNQWTIEGDFNCPTPASAVPDPIIPNQPTGCFFLSTACTAY